MKDDDDVVVVGKEDLEKAKFVFGVKDHTKLSFISNQKNSKEEIPVLFTIFEDLQHTLGNILHCSHHSDLRSFSTQKISRT